MYQKCSTTKLTHFLPIPILLHVRSHLFKKLCPSCCVRIINQRNISYCNNVRKTSNSKCDTSFSQLYRTVHYCLHKSPTALQSATRIHSTPSNSISQYSFSCYLRLNFPRGFLVYRPKTLQVILIAATDYAACTSH
jgi:hypothetical protein